VSSICKKILRKFFVPLSLVNNVLPTVSRGRLRRCWSGIFIRLLVGNDCAAVGQGYLSDRWSGIFIPIVGRGYLSPTQLSAEISPPSLGTQRATNPDTHREKGFDGDKYPRRTACWSGIFMPTSVGDDCAAVGRGYLSPTRLSAEMSPPSPVIERTTNPIHIGRKVSTGINIPVELFAVVIQRTDAAAPRQAMKGKTTLPGPTPLERETATQDHALYGRDNVTACRGLSRR